MNQVREFQRIPPGRLLRSRVHREGEEPGRERAVTSMHEQGLSATTGISPRRPRLSAAPETRRAMRRHPFTTAIEARDHPALVDTLASDVVLHSAVTRTTFDGRETVSELYASVIDSFEEIEVVDEFSGGDTHVFF
jgi:hypothetical protein